MTDCCEKKAEARRYGMFEGPVGDDWFDCGCNKQAIRDPNLVLIISSPRHSLDWLWDLWSQNKVEPNPPSTYDEFVTRYASSEPVQVQDEIQWTIQGVDFGETEARIMAWLASKIDEVGERNARELVYGKPYTYDDRRPKGDARDLIKKIEELPDEPTGKRQFTLSHREQLAQQRRDAKRRR